MRTTARTLALLAVASTIGCAAATVPPGDKLRVPQVSFAWLARNPIVVEIEDARSNIKRGGTQELRAQLKGILEYSLKSSGVTVAEAARSSIHVRVLDYGLSLGDVADLDPAGKKKARMWKGCVSLVGEVLPIDAEPVLARSEQCRQRVARTNDEKSAVLWQAYEAALGELLPAMAQPNVARGAAPGPILAGTATAPATTTVKRGVSTPAPAPQAAATTAAPARQVTPLKPVDRWAPIRDQTLLVLDLRANGVETRVSRLLTTLLLSQLDQVERVRAMGSADVNAVLSAERQKELMGCESATCMAEIGGAIGAAIVLHGEVGRLGSQYTISITAMSTKQATPIARLSELTPTDEDALARALPAVTDKLLTRISERLAVADKR